MRRVSSGIRSWLFAAVVASCLPFTATAQYGSAFSPPAAGETPSPLLGIEGRNLQQDLQMSAEVFADLPQPRPHGITPNDVNGLSIDGYVSYSYGSGLLRMLVDRVSNSSPTRTSGTLRLVVWFSVDPFPAYGYRTATYTLGQLLPNYYFYNIDSGNVAFLAPPTGCYNATIVLEEWSGSEWLYVDYVTTTPKQGINTTCTTTPPPPPPPPSCIANSTTMCMLNGRFKVRLHYLNQYSRSRPPDEGYLNAKSLASSSTSDTSVFWFTDEKNIEYLVKVIDARPFENKIHVGMGAVTDIETWLEVTDTKNGTTREYHKGPGDILGLFDRISFVP